MRVVAVSAFTRFRIPALLGVLLLALCALSGCLPRRAAVEPMSPDALLAVAGFTQPRHTGDLLAGAVPKSAPVLDEETLFTLDRYMVQELTRLRDGRLFQGPASTRQCQEIRTFEDRDKPGISLEYWLEVGECMGADYLLIPQITFWQERVGGPSGATTPAGLTMDMYLADIKGKDLVGRHHFEEIQTALSNNLLTMPDFVRRRGRWISAPEMAREAIVEGILELGL